MKKLWSLLLLTSCFQQGLVGTPQSKDQSTTGGLTDDPPADPTDPKAYITLEKKSGEYLKSVFGNKGFASSRPIQGYGEGSQGETFCISNEIPTDNRNKTATISVYDKPVACRRPFATSNMGSNEEAIGSVYESIETTDTVSLPTRDYAPFVLQGLQLFLGNKKTKPATTADASDKYYSQLNLPALKISLKTAPLVFDSTTGYFSWDNTKEVLYNYAGSGCDFNGANGVGFDIGTDTSLGTTIAQRKQFFVTGLWIFERAPTQPGETTTIDPIGAYQGAANGPSQLFATRASVLASMLLPELTEDNSPSFKFFPGGESTPEFSPSEIPNPFQFNFGLYRQGSIRVNDENNIERDISDYPANTFTDDKDGAIATPMMGRYRSDGALVTDTNGSGFSWQKRVITGLCVQGSRSVYMGRDTPYGAYPAIHALKYELRKIKVYVQ